MTYQELQTILNNERFYIFGTGFVSEMFWNGLNLRGKENNVLGFLVSDPKRGELFHERPVLGMDDAEKDVPVVAAVHEAVYRELEFGDRNVIWIYPFLYDFLYGPPTEEKIMKLDEIRAGQPRDQYWIAARYAAIEGTVNNDRYLTGLYLRSMALHSSADTAERRLRSFTEVIENVREYGFDPLRTISITDRFEMIDGLHRVALAAYFGVGKMNCRIYRHSDIYDKVIGPENTLPERILRENSFSEGDIAVLRAFKEICG